MSKPDPESRDLLTDTIKKLFPPRVELDRVQHERPQKLCERTGKTVSDFVEEALERYLQGEDQSDAADGAPP